MPTIFAAFLAVAAGARLTLLPYAYLADPLPVYHQSQDTRAGVHAYSYAGGPSAKEEVRGLDGVTRGSYSYLDAHGILQSVFYVADEGGFRVAATNLPGDGDHPSYAAGEILLTNDAHLQEHAKAAAHGEPAKEEEEQGTKKRQEGGQEEAWATSRRRRRSLEASPAADQDRQAADPSSQADGPAAAKPSPKDSHELARGSPGRKVTAPLAHAPLLRSLLIPRLTGTATSHQSRIDIHSNVRLRAVQPIGILAEPAYNALLLPARLRLPADQSRPQLHGDLHVETPAETVEIASPTAAAVKLQPLPVVIGGDYNENRIRLHEKLGLEGPNRKDAVKIDGARLDTPIAIATVPVVASKTAIPLVSGVSSQSKAEDIQQDAKVVEVAVPIASEPTLYLAASYGQPIATWPIYAPIAQSSQYRSQVHSSEKIKLAK